MADSLSISVNISADKAFMQKIEGMIPAIADFKEAFEEVGKNLTHYFSTVPFTDQGGNYGTPWQSLAPSTQAFKSIHYREYAAIPLLATTHMQQSFEYSAGTTHLEITNSAEYFKYHQSTAPRRRLPRRPMFGINKTVKDTIKVSIEAAMIKRITKL